MIGREPCAGKLARTVLTGAGGKHSTAVRPLSTQLPLELDKRKDL